MTIKRSAAAAVVVAAAVILAGCQNIQDNPKQAGGTLVGAGLGALAGSQIGSGKGQLAAVALGALAGGWLGSEVGKSLDSADRMAAQRTTQRALESAPSGQSAQWRNPDSGHSGTITPQAAYVSPSGQNCRDFESTTNAGGREERVTLRACRDADGNWKNVQ